METVIYLIRHGDVDNPGNLTYGRERDVHLSETGERQITVLGKMILTAGDMPEAIITSPLTRTVETSKILARICSVSVIQKDSELLETDSKGFVGIPIDKVHTTMGDVYKNNDGSFEIERPEVQADRMKRAFFRALDAYRGRTFLIVSHGDPLAFLCDSLVHPGKPLRPITELRNDLYLQRGTAWRTVVIRDTVFTGWMKVEPQL